MAERYTIVVQSVPGSDVPVINRLRRFLKMALRAYSLRCVEIREMSATTPPRPSPRPSRVILRPEQPQFPRENR